MLKHKTKLVDKYKGENVTKQWGKQIIEIIPTNDRSLLLGPFTTWKAIASENINKFNAHN